MAAKKTSTRAQLKRQLRRLVIARSSFDGAVRACDLATTRVADRLDPLHGALVQSVVISYARPFTLSSGVGALPAGWPRFSSSIERSTHARLLSMRNSTVAHADAAAWTVSIIPPKDPIVFAGRNPGTLSIRVQYEWLTLAEIYHVRRLAEKLSRQGAEDINVLLRKLYGLQRLPDLAFPLTIDNGL